jgi:hypothetical protein
MGLFEFHRLGRRAYIWGSGKVARIFGDVQAAKTRDSALPSDAGHLEMDVSDRRDAFMKRRVVES